MIRTLVLLFLFSTPISVIEAASTKAKGVIRDVDTTTGTVTVAVRNNYVTVRTDLKTRIFRNGEAAELGDLQVTDKANVSYDARTQVAKKIDARGTLEVELERIEGEVLSVDEQQKKVSVQPIGDGQPITFSVTDTTYITVDGSHASLGNLAGGFNVGAVFNPATMDAARIQAESYARVRGVVRDVSVPQNSLTIATGEGDRTITLNVPPGTPISLNDRPASLEDLRRGFLVAASYVRETLQAVRIAATSIAEVQGLIRAVNLDLDIVTISPFDGPPVELHVVESTAISVNGERAPLERLQPGMGARATYHLVSHEAISIAARSDVEECTPVGISGLILRVEVDRGHLAIQPREGDPVVLNITNRTEITLNGDPARLGDLQPGMGVEARFCRETLTATAVAARSDDPGDCTLSSARGLIARVNPDTGALAIALSNTEILTLTVTDRTEITLNGRPGRLSDLRNGMRVEARFCRETLMATVVAAQSEDPGDCVLTGASGLIQRVNPDAGTLSIALSDTAADVLTLNVTDRTEITLDGRPARLSDLRPGMRVAVRFCRQTLIAASIAAVTPTDECNLVSAAGVIVRVNPDANSLSFTGSEGNVITLNVTSRTEITLNGRAARLSDLRPEMRVEARFCRENFNALVIAARTPSTTP
jgi:hypothetical protein